MLKPFTRLAGLCGVLTPIVMLTLVFVSVAWWPQFNWHTNALSDIGVSRTPQLFNATLLIGGLLYLVFVIGFLRWNETKPALAKLAALFLLAGGFGLILIGVFTEAAGRIHYVVAVTYFLATPVAYVLLGIDWQRHGRKLPGLLTLIAGLAALLLIALVPHKGYAVPEILESVVLGAWTLSMGMKMLIEPE
jgi:hypothetical membrane protein